MTSSENLYATPEAPVTHINLIRRESLGKNIAWIGVLLQIPLIAGFGIFIAKMVISFEEITLQSNGDTEIMVGALSEAMVSMILGLVVAIPGYIINIVGYFVSDFRSNYVNRFLIAISVLWLLLFPVGTVLAIIFFIVYSSKK